MMHSEDFDIFWLAYPLKKGKSKAEEHWHRHNPDLAQVMAALEMQKQEKIWLKNKKRFVPEWPHGSTWVNQKRWEDGYDQDFEAYIDYEKNRPARERREREKKTQRIRDEHQDYLEGKTIEALQDIKKDGGHLVGLCGWLIDEVIEAKTNTRKE